MHALHFIIALLQKRLSARAAWAQARRIRCEHCHEAFVYLATGKVSTEASGSRFSETAESLLIKARRALRHKVEDLGKKARVGQALCPGCKRYQSWMVRRSFLRRAGGGALIAGLLLFALGVVAMIIDFTSDPRSTDLAWAATPLAGALVGTTLGGLWGVLTSLRVGPHFGRDDASSMTDAEWLDLIGKCREKKTDPALAWLTRTGFKPGKDQFPIAATFRDEGGATPL